MFQKGKSGNLNGRPKGSKNRASQEIRESLKIFIQNNIGDMQAQYDGLSSMDKLIFMEKVLKFVLPSLKAIELTSDGEALRPVIGFDEIKIVHTNIKDFEDLK